MLLTILMARPNLKILPPELQNPVPKAIAVDETEPGWLPSEVWVQILIESMRVHSEALNKFMLVSKRLSDLASKIDLIVRHACRNLGYTPLVYGHGAARAVRKCLASTEGSKEKQTLKRFGTLRHNRSGVSHLTPLSRYLSMILSDDYSVLDGPDPRPVRLERAGGEKTFAPKIVDAEILKKFDPKIAFSDQGEVLCVLLPRRAPERAGQLFFVASGDLLSGGFWANLYVEILQNPAKKVIRSPFAIRQ